MPKFDRLPKWAKELIESKDNKIRNLEHDLANLCKAHAILENQDWFVLNNSRLEDRADEKSISLWFLDKDDPHRFCTLYCGDTLLVGRRKR